MVVWCLVARDSVIGNNRGRHDKKLIPQREGGEHDGRIKGFVLEKGMKGLSAPKIEGKMSLRGGYAAILEFRGHAKPVTTLSTRPGPVDAPMRRFLAWTSSPRPSRWSRRRRGDLRDVCA